MATGEVHGYWSLAWQPVKSMDDGVVGMATSRVDMIGVRD